MKKLLKKNWYLVVLSIVFGVLALAPILILTNIIGSLCNSIIIGWLISTLIATSIVTLPLKRLYNNGKREIIIKKKKYICIIGIYFIILGSLTFVMGVMR